MEIKNLTYKFPYTCYINLTEACNLRCLHCLGSYGISGKNELTLAQWKDVIDQLAEMKVTAVIISGGEPTIYPNFKEIVKYLEKRSLHYVLTTNGILSDDIRKFITKHRRFMIGVKISLDGYDSATHNFIRKGHKNAFRETMKSIWYFKRKRIQMTIATVLHIKNIKNFNKFSSLIKEINPISWFISPIVNIGRAVNSKEIKKFYESFDLDYWLSLRSRNRGRGINVRLIDIPEKKEGLLSYECAAGLNMCEIHSDGQVSPCTMSRIGISPEYIKFENIKNKKIKDIWVSESFNTFRSFMNKGCAGCKALSRCNKCVAQSFIYFKNGYSPTPFCVAHGEDLGLEKIKEYKSEIKELI